jgi:hypothetical protein
MKFLINLLISSASMVIFCILTNFIMRCGAYFWIGGEFLFSAEDIQDGVINGGMLGCLLSVGIGLSNIFDKS